MKIVMLGQSGAGKTTYMALMYVAMQEGAAGFTLATNESDHRRLTSNARSVLGGYGYPLATDSRTEYKLRAHCHGIESIDMTWSDYRGGSVTERSNSAQAMQLRADLDAADGVMLFTDADDLIRNRSARRNVATLVTFLLRAVNARARPAAMPLVIALTKTDILNMSEHRIRRQLREPYTPLTDALHTAPHIRGTIVELACGMRPRNILDPLLWILHVAVGNRVAARSVELDTALNDARMISNIDTPTNRFMSVLNGVPTNQVLLQRKLDGAIGSWTAVKSLHAVSLRLESQLAHLERYGPERRPAPVAAGWAST